MLLLTTPAQHIAQNPAVECDPRRVKQWLADLPTDNAQSTVAQLLAALKPFNELQLDVKTRLKLLEIYHTAFDTLLYTYDEMHLRSLALTQDTRKQLSDDIMWVYLELANGYKSIVKAIYEGNHQAPTKTDIQLAIYRGIELITNALIYAFRDHRIPPPLVYLEIHQLYFLAEQYQLTTQSIGSLSSKTRNPSIQHLYKQIMLLIAADAYAYDGFQISELYELLDKYTDSSELATQPNPSAKTPGFFIDFNEDAGPHSCAKLRIDGLLETQRILKVDDVVQRIVADVNKEKQVPLHTMRAGELRLLRLFINNLHKSSRLREQRVPLTGSVHVAYAIEASCYYLLHRDRFVDTPVESMDGIEVRDLDMFEAEHELSSWQTVNATQNGLMLSAEQDTVSQFVVGEVVSVVESITATREPLINTGLIRWIRHSDDKVQMGVEFLPGIPMAVMCETVANDASDAVNFQGLYYPSNKTSKQPASLLFEFNQFRYATKFMVDVAGRRYCIEPVKILNESPVHVQFGFRIINA